MKQDSSPVFFGNFNARLIDRNEIKQRAIFVEMFYYFYLLFGVLTFIYSFFFIFLEFFYGILFTSLSLSLERVSLVWKGELRGETWTNPQKYRCGLLVGKLFHHTILPAKFRISPAKTAHRRILEIVSRLITPVEAV